MFLCIWLMAVSIVSKQYGDDSQTPIIDPTTNDGSFSPVSSEDIVVASPIDQDNFSVENTIDTKEDVSPQEISTNNDEKNDTGWLNDLHPEETVKQAEETKPMQESSEVTIPNMYIKADTETMDVPEDVAIFSEEKKEDGEGFDMDDLLGDELQKPISNEEISVVVNNPIETVATNNAIQQTATPDPFVQKKEEIKEEKIQEINKKPLASIAPKKSLTKSLAMVAAGLFGVVVIGFIVMTMFPAGIDGSSSQEEIIAQEEPILEELVEEHAAAQEEPKTPQEIARGELVNYSSLGEQYYALGRDLKDRNMVRYALYVEKKAKDLIDMLDLDPNMDTKDIVVYFAQFDDYLKTLDDWKATLGATLPVSGSSTIVEEDMFNQPEIPFTDIQTTTADDTNTGSIQSGASLTEPEQSELSDG